MSVAAAALFHREVADLVGTSFVYPFGRDEVIDVELRENETMNTELDDACRRAHASVEPGAYVCVALSDTGEGMPPAVRRRVFEPFFTTKSRADARGLGLTSVYGIVKENGGNVWAYSELGHGSTFKIYLPRVEPATRPAVASAASSDKTVLVVEDESDVRALVREVLESASFSVLEARNGTEGVRIVEQYEGDVQLMISDIVMPRMGGPDMAEKVQAVHPEIPVIFMSGYTPRDVVRRRLLRESDIYLQEPSTPDQLVGKVRDVLVR